MPLESSKPQPGDLTIEQQFRLRAIESQVRNMNTEQAQQYVVEVFRQMFIKDNLVKYLIKNPP